MESIEHLMFHCNVMDTLWEMFCSWLRECEVSLQCLTTTHILCGLFNNGDYFFIPNHLIMAAKLLTCNCKLNNTHPSLQFKFIVHDISVLFFFSSYFLMAL